MTDGVTDENFGFDTIVDGISIHQISWTFKCRVSSHFNYSSTYLSEKSISWNLRSNIWEGKYSKNTNSIVG